MPRDISGNYTLPAGNPVVDNTIIDTTWGNGTMNDLAAQLNNVVTKDGVVGPTAPLKGANGTAAAPMWSFTSEPGMGIYRIGAGVLGFAVAGAFALSVVAQGLAAPLGAVGSPSYSFTGDLDTGMWSAGPNILTWSTGGVAGMQLQASQLTLASPFVHAPWLGAVGTPSYSFNGDLNTGWWSPGADQIAESTAGVQRRSVSATGNHTFAAPSAGNTVAITQLAGGAALTATDGTTSLTTILSTGLFFGTSSNHSVNLRSNNIDRVTIAAAGNVSIAAPSAGVGLAVSGFAGSAVAAFKQGAATAAFISIAGNNATPGTNSFDIQQDGVGDVDIVQRTNGRLSLYTNALERIRIAAAGNVTVNAPSSGTPVAVNTSSGVGIQLQGSTTSANYVRFSNTSGDGGVGVDSSAGGVIVSGSPAYSLVIGTFGATSLVLGAGNAAGMVLTSDRRFYGTALHNNAGAVTGTTNQYVASGTYTPTITNQVNVGASSIPAAWKWIRDGNVVHMIGAIAITPTAAAGTVTVCRITLPIASNFATSYDGLGSMTNRTDLSNRAQAVNSNGATDDLSINFAANSTTPSDWVIVASYEVL